MTKRFKIFLALKKGSVAVIKELRSQSRYMFQGCLIRYFAAKVRTRIQDLDSRNRYLFDIVIE